MKIKKPKARVSALGSRRAAARASATHYAALHLRSTLHSTRISISDFVPAPARTLIYVYLYSTPIAVYMYVPRTPFIFISI